MRRIFPFLIVLSLLGAFGWRLSPEDHDLLTRGYPDQKTVSDVEPLR